MSNTTQKPILQIVITRDSNGDSDKEPYNLRLIFIDEKPTWQSDEEGEWKTLDDERSFYSLSILSTLYEKLISSEIVFKPESVRILSPEEREEINSHIDYISEKLAEDPVRNLAGGIIPVTVNAGTYLRDVRNLLDLHDSHIKRIVELELRENHICRVLNLRGMLLDDAARKFDDLVASVTGSPHKQRFWADFATRMRMTFASVDLPEELQKLDNEVSNLRKRAEKAERDLALARQEASYPYSTHYKRVPVVDGTPLQDIDSTASDLSEDPATKTSIPQEHRRISVTFSNGEIIHGIACLSNDPLYRFKIITDYGNKLLCGNSVKWSYLD